MAFDRESAKRAGYTDQEIDQYLVDRIDSLLAAAPVFLMLVALAGGLR